MTDSSFVLFWETSSFHIVGTLRCDFWVCSQSSLQLWSGISPAACLHLRCWLSGGLTKFSSLNVSWKTCTSNIWARFFAQLVIDRGNRPSMRKHVKLVKSPCLWGSKTFLFWQSVRSVQSFYVNSS